MVMETYGSLKRSLERAGESLSVSNFLTFFLFSVFGVGSWLAVNGIWAELSVLVVSLPECYDLPAVFSVVIQLANVGPILYTFVRFCLVRCSFRPMVVEIGAVYTLVCVGILSCVALSFVWDRTAVIAGDRHSVALIALTFTLALVDCTSSLVFIPFMKHFPACYISALFIGEGMSGVLPSVAALSQGFVNDSLDCANHYLGVRELGINFSPNVYFMYVGCLIVLCGLAFTAIITLPVVRQQMLPTTVLVSIKDGSPHVNSPTHNSSSSRFGDNSRLSSEEVTESREERERLTRERDISPLLNSSGDESGTLEPTQWHSNSPSFTNTSAYLSRLSSVAWNNVSLLVCMFVLNFVSNGALTAVSAFVFKPYGNTVYTVAINLGILSGPLITVFYVFVSHKSRDVVVVLTSISTLLGLYLLVMGTFSPDPLLKHHTTGKTLIVSQ